MAELETTLEEFWRSYRVVQDRMPENPQWTRPVMWHGAERHGHVKGPLMVVSYHTLLSCYGGNQLNSQGLLGLIVSRVT